MNYKNKKSFDERLDETTKILQKYPDRIPCIIEKSDTDISVLPNIDKSKFLIPNDLTMSQLIYIIRKRVKIEPEQAIFIFCNGKLIENYKTLENIYKDHQDKDKYLYLLYSGENTFG